MSVSKSKSKGQELHTVYGLLCTMPLGGGCWPTSGTAGFADAEVNVDFVMKAAELLTDLGVSITSLLTYETGFTSSNVLFTGLWGVSSASIGGEKTPEEPKVLAGDLRLI